MGEVWGSFSHVGLMVEVCGEGGLGSFIGETMGVCCEPSLALVSFFPSFGMSILPPKGSTHSFVDLGLWSLPSKLLVLLLGISSFPPLSQGKCGL